MPVILDPDSYDFWLDPGMNDVRAVSELVEALRCEADAVLSREQSREQRGERR
jgi:putative SOS response-associated peptidase YedK